MRGQRIFADICLLLIPVQIIGMIHDIGVDGGNKSIQWYINAISGDPAMHYQNLPSAEVIAMCFDGEAQHHKLEPTRDCKILEDLASVFYERAWNEHWYDDPRIGYNYQIALKDKWKFEEAYSVLQAVNNQFRWYEPAYKELGLPVPGKDSLEMFYFQWQQQAKLNKKGL